MDEALNLKELISQEEALNPRYTAQRARGEEHLAREAAHKTFFKNASKEAKVNESRIDDSGLAQDMANAAAPHMDEAIESHKEMMTHNEEAEESFSDVQSDMIGARLDAADAAHKVENDHNKVIKLENELTKITEDVPLEDIEKFSPYVISEDQQRIDRLEGLIQGAERLDETKRVVKDALNILGSTQDIDDLTTQQVHDFLIRIDDYRQSKIKHKNVLEDIVNHASYDDSPAVIIKDGGVDDADAGTAGF